MKRNVAALHDRAGANGELIAARVAQEHSGLGLAFHATDVVSATVGASDFYGPTRRFDMSGGSGYRRAKEPRVPGYTTGPISNSPTEVVPDFWTGC